MRDTIVAIVINLYTLVDIAEQLKYKNIDKENVIDALNSIQRMLCEIESLLNEIDATKETLNNYNINNLIGDNEMKQFGREVDTTKDKMKKIFAGLYNITDWVKTYTCFNEEELEIVRNEANAIQIKIKEIKELLIEIERKLNA